MLLTATQRLTLGGEPILLQDRCTETDQLLLLSAESSRKETDRCACADCPTFDSVDNVMSFLLTEGQCQLEHGDKLENCRRLRVLVDYPGERSHQSRL